MLNCIRNILLKEQVFTLSQLNRLSPAAWKRLPLFGHAKLKRPSILQLYDSVCDVRSTALTYLQRLVFLALGTQRSLSMPYYHSFHFFASLFITILLMCLFFASIC